VERTFYRENMGGNPIWIGSNKGKKKCPQNELEKKKETKVVGQGEKKKKTFKKLTRG